ncbi:MAG: glycosyltransferase family 4 protein [Acidimicrobiales bacterium]
MAQPLRIALVHPFCWPEVRRGGERLAHDLAWYLAGAGHQVELITGSWAGASVTEEDGVVVRRHQLHDPAALRRHRLGPTESFGATAAAALLRRRYDVVHSLTPSGALAAKLTGHRCIYTVLGHPSADDFALRPGTATLFRSAVRSADVTTALSRSAADRVARITGRASQLRLLPPGVRLDLFTPNLQPRLGPVRILFASDSSEVYKGVHHALAALGRLRRSYPEARLVLCGPGDPAWAVDGVRDSLDPSLARTDPLAVEGLGPDGAALLDRATDRLADVGPGALPDLYRSATVTVLPSRDEAFGLVLAESLACGTPVACSSEAGMLEVVDRPEVGRTARFGDDDGLARALAESVELARQAPTPGHCADHARRWGWAESVGPAYEALYLEVAGRR